MLFQYKFPDNHPLGALNKYLLFFVQKIQTTNSKSKFDVSKYFPIEFAPILNMSPKLIEKFQLFFESFKVLPNRSKNHFLKLLIDSEDFQLNFSDVSTNCKAYNNDSIKKLIGNDTFYSLAGHLFEALKSKRWKIEEHYIIIYNALPHKVCPFCGISPLHRTFREDYDHLAPKAIYPLAVVNPKNLAPMCHVCNSKNKTTKDVFYDENGARRMFVYPYSEHINVEVKFTGSIIPQTDHSKPNGDWVIDFVPSDDRTKNWDQVFNIKKRFIEDVIMPNFETWVDDFVKDCIIYNLDLSLETNIVAELKKFGDGFNRKWYEHSNIVRGPLFQYLASNPNSAFLRGIINRYRYLKQLSA